MSKKGCNPPKKKMSKAANGNLVVIARKQKNKREKAGKSTASIGGES